MLWVPSLQVAPPFLAGVAPTLVSSFSVKFFQEKLVKFQPMHYINFRETTRSFVYFLGITGSKTQQLCFIIYSPANENLSDQRAGRQSKLLK